MRKPFSVERTFPPLPSLFILLSVLLLSLYYAMPISIIKLGSLRHLYLAGAVCLFAVGIFLERDAKLFFSFALMELVILLMWKALWNTQLTFGNYVMPVTVFNIFMTAAHYYMINERLWQEKLLFFWILAVNSITAVTTIIGSRKEPYAIRNSVRADIAADTKYRWRAMNLGTWNYVYGIVFLVPCLVLIFKYGKHKLLWAAWLMLIMLCVLVSQITIALFLAVIGAVIVFFGKPENRLSCMVLVGIIVALVVFMAYLTPFVYALREITTKLELLDIARKMDTIYVLLTQNTATGNAGDRLSLYGMSLSTFIDHPLFGVIFVKDSLTDMIGFHSEICDLLGGIGSIGLVSLGLFIYNRVFMVKTFVTDKYRYSVGMMTAGVLLLAVLNPVLYVPQISMHAFLMPTLITHMLENDAL